MTAKRAPKPHPELPSGHPGVYRNPKGWEAYVAAPAKLILLGVYPTIRAAVSARHKYWKARLAHEQA
jgi:hypothetical protein